MGKKMYGCSAKDCVRPTPGNFCDDHARWCKSCGDEYQAKDLNVDGDCAKCVDGMRDVLDEASEYGDSGGMPNIAVEGVRRFG